MALTLVSNNFKDGETLEMDHILSADYGFAPGYGGPCPPEGHGPHHYMFTLFAVRQAALPVNADTSAAIVGFQLHFNTIAKATMTGLFGR